MAFAHGRLQAHPSIDWSSYSATRPAIGDGASEPENVLHCEVRVEPPEVRPFVDGELSESGGLESVDVINPSTGRRLLSIPRGCESDVNRAAASARKAFDDGRWSESAPSFRKETLLRLAQLIENEAAAFDALDAEEMGKPVSTAASNAAYAAGHMRYNAEATDKMIGDLLPSDHNSLVALRRVPRGVVGAVIPWNFPTHNAVLKIAPALAAGNCVVLKPSEFASRAAMRLAHLAIQAGVPNGVLNVVPGLGETVGRALASHADVDMLTFTGSTAVGRLILQYAGQSNMKVVMAECGGKSPQIVFADGVDLDAASASIAALLLVNQGQLCSVGSRLLVERSIEKPLLEKILDRIQAIVIGPALDPRTTFGPLASAKQCERVMRYIVDAPSEGAKLLTGGRQILKESGGYFVEPTIFTQVSPSARIAQQEIFGPVLSVIPFDNEAEAVRIANGTPYGLAAYVWTADLSRGLRITRAIRSLVIVNATAPSGEGAGHALSWEPMGSSGVGVESGMRGLESYLRRQLICINHA